PRGRGHHARKTSMASVTEDLEERLDRLFRGPLEGFVATRDALAKDLKAAGDKENAARVKALKRPSVSAWAVNQLRFAAPGLWTSLLDAADRLRRVPPAELPKAVQERKEALAAARRKAEELLAAAGHGIATSTVQRLAATLESFALHGNAPGRPVA